MSAKRLQREAPSLATFTKAEQRLIRRLRTPDLVQHYFNRLPYNIAPPGRKDTMRSFRQVLRHGKAHCMEAALAAVCILEQHGYPPLLMSLESVDGLDHVLFVYRRRGRWGSVGRSRDPGLHGRKPAFRSLRALALSYFDAYIDATGCITGYGRYDLRDLSAYDWRFSARGLWKVERALVRTPHRRIGFSHSRVRKMRARYLAFRATYGKKPLFYCGRDKWTEVPKEFL